MGRSSPEARIVVGYDHRFTSYSTRARTHVCARIWPAHLYADHPGNRTSSFRSLGCLFMVCQPLSRAIQAKRIITAVAQQPEALDMLRPSFSEPQAQGREYLPARSM